MLTRKEINGLNFVYKKLSGRYEEYPVIKNFLKDRYKMSDKDAFELAYLYDKNFEQSEGEDGMGNFNNVTEPIRMTYEEYLESIPWQVNAVMGVINDEHPNPEDYEFDGYNMVEYNGDEYYIYEGAGELSDVASSNYDPCNDISYDDVYEGYFYITDTDRRLLASDEADSRVENMDDSEIIMEAEIEDKIDDLDELDNLKEQIEEKTEEMEELVNQLDDVNEEEKNDLEERIANFETEIEELESKVEEIEDEGTREDIIENAREELRSNYYDQVYDELDNPIDYFREHGYDSVDEMVENTPLQFDCDEYANNEFENADIEQLGHMAGYSNTEEVRVDGRGWVIVAWN